MRMMMKVSIPVAAGNKALLDGTLPKVMMAFVDQMKPEAAYFFPEGGTRNALFVFDLQDPTMIPTVAEPFFLQLDATIEMQPAMNLEEMKAGVAKAATKRASGAPGSPEIARAQPR